MNDTPNCPRCGHADHGVRACPSCLENGTCWQPIMITGGDGDQTAAGAIEMVTGLEKLPCMLCAKWDKEFDRLVRHFIAHGLRPLPNGNFETPIKDDFGGKQGLVINPRDFGFCRDQSIPTDMLASCSHFVPVKSLSQFQKRRMS